MKKEGVFAAFPGHAAIDEWGSIKGLVCGPCHPHYGGSPISPTGKIEKNRWWVIDKSDTPSIFRGTSHEGYDTTARNGCNGIVTPPLANKQSRGTFFFAARDWQQLWHGGLEVYERGTKSS